MHEALEEAVVGGPRQLAAIGSQCLLLMWECIDLAEQSVIDLVGVLQLTTHDLVSHVFEVAVLRVKAVTKHMAHFAFPFPLCAHLHACKYWQVLLCSQLLNAGNGINTVVVG